MNELKVFNISNDYEKIRNIENGVSSSYLGFFYILEWDKNRVKIGSSAHPYQRIKQLKRLARYANVNLSRFAVSQKHSNYIDNEHYLHEHFKSFREQGTELFSISFEKAISSLPSDIQFLDESESMEKQAEANLKKLTGAFDFIRDDTTYMSSEDVELLLNIEKREAKVDMSDILIESSNLDIFSPESKSVLLAKAVEVLVGYELVPPSAFLGTT